MLSFILFPFLNAPSVGRSVPGTLPLYSGSCSIHVHTHSLPTVLRVYTLMHTPGYTLPKIGCDLNVIQPRVLKLLSF